MIIEPGIKKWRAELKVRTNVDNRGERPFCQRSFVGACLPVCRLTDEKCKLNQQDEPKYHRRKVRQNSLVWGIEASSMVNHEAKREKCESDSFEHDCVYKFELCPSLDIRFFLGRKPFPLIVMYGSTRKQINPVHLILLYCVNPESFISSLIRLTLFDMETRKVVLEITFLDFISCLRSVAVEEISLHF